MPILALALIAAGVIAAYSGLTGQSPVDEFVKAVRSGRTDGRDAGARPLGVVTVEGENRTTRVASDGGGRVGSPSVAAGSGSTSGNPCAAMPVPTTLVPIGQGSHRLAPDAAKAFKAAEAAVGRTIRVTDTFRTRDQQADCYRRKPDVCAPPGTSCHEKGVAIDIVDMTDAGIIAALSAAGWVRYAPGREPWHWSYGVRG